MRRFLGLLLVLGIVQVVLYIAIQVVIFRTVDLRFVAFARFLLVPQVEAVVLALATGGRSGSRFEGNDRLLWAAALFVIAASTLSLAFPPARPWITGILLLLAGAGLIFSRRLPGIVLGLGIMAAGVEAIAPWVDRAMLHLLPHKVILLRKLAAYGLPMAIALLLLVIIDASPEVLERRLIGVASGALLVVADVVACNYFLHPFLTPWSAAMVTFSEILFAASIGLAALLFMRERKGEQV
jgi:hypothetical protein